MWLLRLPLSAAKRLSLPRGRYFIPWHFNASEVSRLAGLLAGLLEGVEHHLILPFPTVRSFLMSANPSDYDDTLIIATIGQAPVDPRSLDEVFSLRACRHLLVHHTEPQESGYAWQERYLKHPLVDCLRAIVHDQHHPLVSFNIATLPIQKAASLTTDVLSLVELLEATVEHRLSRATEGTSAVDYEKSLYAVAGERFVERMLRLLPGPMDAAIAVLKKEGQGVWSEEQFRVGAKALERLGLAQVAGGFVSLGPLARQARQLPIPSEIAPRRWLVETASILDSLRGEVNRNSAVFAKAGIAAISELFHALRDASVSPATPKKDDIERVETWVREGADFEERCNRARDFLSDPDRAAIVRTNKYIEYDVWLAAIRGAFQDDEWERVGAMYSSDEFYDETIPEAQRRKDQKPDDRSSFRGFLVLDRKRFDVQRQITRHIDFFLFKQPQQRLALGRWLAFALFEAKLEVKDKPLFTDLLSYCYRTAVEAGDGSFLEEANGIVRRCYALALKNNYTDERAHIEADARELRLDTASIVPAGERPSAYLEAMKQAFQAMLEGAFADARNTYEQAFAIAAEGDDAFDAWVALHGESEAAWDELDQREKFGQEARALMDDYHRRIKALEQKPDMAAWLSRAEEHREQMKKLTIEKLVRERRQRLSSETSYSINHSPHEFWTLFRDLETIPAPPELQQKYIQPLIDFGGFDPDEEFAYRLRLDVNKAEDTKAWLLRMVDTPWPSLEEAQKRDEALLAEFKREGACKLERLRRVKVFPQIAKIFRVADLDWACAFLSKCNDERNDPAWYHRTDFTAHASAVCGYVHIETRTVGLDMLEQFVAGDISWHERLELARGLNHEAVSIQQWVGLHEGAAERLSRLTLQLVKTAYDEHEKDVKEFSTDQLLTPALVAIVKGAQKFQRVLPEAMLAVMRAWADEVLSNVWDNAAIQLAVLLAPSTVARDEMVTRVLGMIHSATTQPTDATALEAPIQAWLHLVEANVDPKSTAMVEAAQSLWGKLEAFWSDLLGRPRFAPRESWAHVAFLSSWLASGMASPLLAVREKLLELIKLDPENLALCAPVIDPTHWGDLWPSFVALVWKQAGGGDGSDPVASRRGAVALFSAWLLDTQESGEQLPAELCILLDLTLLAVLDESVSVANHAAYGVLRYAARVHMPHDIQRIRAALRKIALDPRVNVRGAAAYAGTYLPLLKDVAEPIRAEALAIDKSLETDPYAIIQRQRVYGALDGA